MRGSLMRRTKAATGAALVALFVSMVSSGPVIAHRSPDDRPIGLEAAAPLVTNGPAQRAAMLARNFTVVGHSALGGGGLNGDVWEHRGYAYVGVWSGPCPATGVKVADVRNPSNPRLVSRLRNPARTSAEDVVVRHVATARFTGDLAVAGIQTCDDPEESPAFRGLAFYDVTDPSHPQQVGRYWVNKKTGGCHEVDLAVTDGGRVLAACANPFAEQSAGTDEVIVVDATNPFGPHKVGGFALGRDHGVDPARTRQNVGCFAASFAHSVRFTNGAQTLFASYWDYGTLRFDVRAAGELSRPVGRTDIAPPDEDADNHSMTLAKRGGTMVVNPEDFSPPGCGRRDEGWGEAHIYTNSRGKNRLLSTFSTRNSRSMRTDGFYSIHNTEVAGTRRSQMFSSWYSDGIVWWSLANRRNPVMKGKFVPPPTEDPTGTFPPIPIVWGVFPDRNSNLIFASDINSGLWILRPTRLGDF